MTVAYLTQHPIDWLLERLEEEKNEGVLSIAILPSERILQKIADTVGHEPVVSYYFSHDVFPFEEVRLSKGIRNSRIASLAGLHFDKSKWVMTTLHGLLRKTIPPHVFEERVVCLEVNQETTLSSALLHRMGYERVFTVRDHGEYSIKGDIIDIFPPDSNHPYRIELFDATVERIRSFDSSTQKSISGYQKIAITVAAECSNFEEDQELARQRILRAERTLGVVDSEASDQLDGLETVAGIYYEKQSCLIDYTRGKTSFYLVNPDEAFEETARRERETLELLAEKPVRKFLYTRYGALSPEIIRKLPRMSVVSLSEPVTVAFDETRNVESVEKRIVHKREEVIQRTPLIDWTELEPGDFVVHREFGVGRYLGARTITNPLGTKEYLTIEYADGGKIYVPVERVDRVHKYVGPSETVTLSSLKGNQWRRVKKKVQEDIRNRVKELAILYGNREKMTGLSLTGDPELEEAFVKTFPYVETEDQNHAIEDVLSDLASQKPMDRLVAGDSGYGKTEVALRAIFRAVTSGKQTAVLVPTVVLARQHYRTFKKRLSPFGISVDILDRYRTPKEKSEIWKKISSGSMDVIVGTHGLLSKRVEFADLGLVVIDEEQLFGVSQKDHFKRVRLQVNVLSMSATPIPRTLYMALSGLREFSVISTPPLGRSMPETYVTEHNNRLVRTAVLREVNRGGQVIYVRNRVRELSDLEQELKEIAPEIRIGVAHGQMNKRTFEKNVNAFYAGELDLLLCSTIIESGVDIPNANTLIVDDAYRYGLSQLYQLRGRVGRSNRRAFAYFLRRNDRLSPEARARLKALKDLSGSGGGLKLAMRDMEIRGFGTLLGDEQHGNITSVGLYMYRQMVDRAVAEVSGKQVLEESNRLVDTELRNLPLDIVIPEEYVRDSIERLKIYRRIALATSHDLLTDIREEMRDRFGELPTQATSLFEFASLRLAAYLMGIKTVEFDAVTESIKISYTRDLSKDALKPYVHVVNARNNTVMIHGVKHSDVIPALRRITGRTDAQ